MTSREKFIQYLEDEKSYIKQYISREVQKSVAKTSVNTNDRIGIKKVYMVLNEKITEQSKEYSDIKYLIRVMKISDDEWRDLNGINNITGILSEYIEKTPSLRLNEKLDLLMEEVQRNIENGILTYISEQSIIIDPSTVERVGLTLEEMKNILENSSISELLEKKDDELSPEELKAKEVIEEGTDSIKEEELERIISGHNLIEKYYLLRDEKLKNGKNEKVLTHDDIEKTIEGLNKIGITESFCSSIKYLLERNLIDQQKRKPNVILPKIKKENSKHYITDKEYKQIKKEILNYFNPYTGEVKGNPTEEEVLYCAQLMLKIETEKDIVRTFFRKTEKNLENPITEMLRNEEKINYYRDKVMVEEELNTMNDSFKEIFITTPEDYVFWKDTINQSLQTIKGKLPKMYEYELNKAATTDIKQKTLKK